MTRPEDKISDNEVTDERLYLDRRLLLKRSAAAGALTLSGLPLFTSCIPDEEAEAANPQARTEPINDVLPAPAEYTVGDEWTSENDVTHYNNFYELGTDKDDPAQNAHYLKTEPWSVVIEGEVAKPGRVPLEDLLRPHPLQERIYRLRCVERWSMVIPWIGIPLVDVLKRFEPTSKARFVAFETLYDPEQLPGQNRSVLEWPYREGLRIDEAVHPLALLAVGLYGKTLPGQNGAPIRLVIPWKYGFKSIKSIVKIRLEEQEPMTSWNQRSPTEYGFYANVNPEVAHPRWSQARERRIGEWTRRPTLPFNGYADQVANLYAGMDLSRNY